MISGTHFPGDELCWSGTMSEGSRTLSTSMSKVDEGPPTPPIPGQKASRLVLEARSRAGLSQSELARRTGLPVNTVYRIEHGLVDPKLGTLERLLTVCGWTLAAEHRPQIDSSEIRELVRRSPLGRLGWPEQRSWASRAVRLLEILAARRVSFVVVGATAERLHGAPVPVHDVHIRWLQGQSNAYSLTRALKVGNRRFQRIGVTAVSCSSMASEELLLGARWIVLPSGRSIPVAALDHLIRTASPPRADLLRCARDEEDREAAGSRRF
jgi:transcriptional regulator with XRE-family HTH domain